MDVTLFSAFQQAALTWPEKTALIVSQTGMKITFRQLLDQVNQFANDLKHRYSVKSGERVGVLLQNQPEFVVAFFALQKLGAVVLPLSYRLSSAELETIAADCQMVGLVSCTDFEETFQPLLSHLSWVMSVETFGLESDVELSSLEAVSQSASAELAVLIYTSGTTGKPKGVMLSHQNLLEDAKANSIAIEATDQDRFVTCSPLFHVFGLTNVMLTALLQGASIVLVKRFNPKAILEAISRYRVTFLAAVPTMYQMMLALLPDEAYDLSSLRVCHSGASPMPQVVFQAVEQQFGVPVQEGYGQSEASSIITSNPLHGIRKPGSIGKGLLGLTVEIVDQQGQVLPPFEVGELRVQGKTVMLGYWNRPEVTAKTVRDGWLYTSDLGYTDEDGYIFLMGRQDDLINVGGAKVYPQEVEDVLYQHPDINACAVVAEASELYHQCVAAYIVSEPGAELTLQAVQVFCKPMLADYKIPKVMYLVQEIPKGATGKILRHQLKPPANTSA